LAQGLVEQDRAADVLRQVGRGQQQLAVGAAVLFGVLDADAGEALGDGAGGLVDGDDPLARGNHGEGGFGKLFDAHSRELRAGDMAAQYSRSAPPEPRGCCASGRSLKAVPARADRTRTARARPAQQGPLPRKRPAALLQSVPRPCAPPSSPTCSRRRVLVAPWVSMVSPLVNTTRSPDDSRPAATSRPTASRAASRAPWPRLSWATANTSRIRLMRRRAPGWRENA